MNHVYRLVWNVAGAVWVAVSEIARNTGKGAQAGRRERTVLLSRFGAPALAFAALATSALGWAQTAVVAPGMGNANVYLAPNGVTVVNVATPNSAGLSHNRYTQFNVDPIGLILNNASSAGAGAAIIMRNSQLAGQVSANFNLNAAANVILNEVVSNNRSRLAGFTEVLGARADVVLANPYGITCSGCGFINTDRVTLSTGVPFFSANGSLGGFDVGRGDILINGTGLNASAQQVLDLVTRWARIEAPINAQDLSISTGTNRWDYGTRAVDASAASTDAAPAIAIDSSALGGMYANRIRLTATEAGVGVRMLGEAAATVDDFTLDAAGRIEISTQVSAKRDVLLASSSTDAAALALVDATATAGRNVQVRATNGGISLDRGALIAAEQLEVTAATSLTAGAAARLQAGTTLNAGAGLGDLDLGAAAVLANGRIDLSAQGQVRTQAGEGQGVQSKGGDIHVDAGAGLSNAGTVSADTGNLLVRTDVAVSNSGTLNAGAAVDIADRQGNGTQSFANSGTVHAGSTFTAQAATVDNQSTGWIQAALGSTVQAASLNNAGTWLLSQQADAKDRVTVAGMATNSGALQSAAALQLDAGSVANSGQLLVGSNLTVNTTTDFSNTGSGTVQAAQTLSVQAGRDLQNTRGATVQGNDVALVADALSNAGAINATRDASLVAGTLIRNEEGATVEVGRDLQLGAAAGAGGTPALENSGTLLAQGRLDANVGAIHNSGKGWIQAGAGSAVQGSTVQNDGTWLLSMQNGGIDTLTASAALINSGVLQSAQEASVQAAEITNRGGMLVTGDLTLDADGTLINSGTVQSASMLTLSSGGELTNSNGTIKAASLSAQSGGVLNNSGVISADTGDATLRVAGGLTSSGELHAANKLDIADRNGAATAAFSNSGSVIAGTQLVLQGSTLVNDKSGWVQAGTSSTLTGSSLNNAGTLLLATQAGHASTVNLSGALTNSGKLQALNDALLTAQRIDNQASALLRTGGALTARVASGQTFSNAGTVQAGGTLDVSGDLTIDNATTGTLLADRLALSAATVTNKGIVQGGSAADSSIAASGKLTNSGTLTVAATGSGAGTVAAQQIDNAGTLQSLGNLSVAVGTGGLQSAGSILANGNVALSGRDGATYTATVGGRISSGGLLSVQGNSNSTLQINGTADGNTVDVDVGLVNIGASGVLSSRGKLDLDASTLTLAAAGTGSNAPTGRIMAAMGAAPSATGSVMGTLRVSSDFTNNGLLYSADDLAVYAPSITVGATGAISALDALTVRATGGYLTVQQDGLLYAGRMLDARAAGTLTNSGNIESGQDLNLQATTLVNNRVINAQRDVAITATVLRNEMQGATKYTNTTKTEGCANVANADEGCNVKELESGNDGGSGGNKNFWRLLEYTYKTTEGWTYNASGFKPQITAGSNATLNFNSASNLGGTIHALETLNLVGQGSNANFTNNDLSTVETLNRVKWMIEKEESGPAGGIVNFGWRPCGPGGDPVCTMREPNRTSDAPGLTTPGQNSGLYATTLIGSGFALTNSGLPYGGGAQLDANTNLNGVRRAATPEAPSAMGGQRGQATEPAIGQAATNSVTAGSNATGGHQFGGATGLSYQTGLSYLDFNRANGVNGSSFGGIRITLPTNPNGLFVTVRSPDARYLVESNPLYLSGGSKLGSSYLADLLGYSADQTMLLLGDAGYEAYLVRQQVISQTGRAVLASYGSADSQMRELMQNAADQSGALGLNYGQALTPAQQAGLKHDIVWMVQTEVDGQRVLAPVVYLSPATKSAIVTGAVISVQSADLNLTSLTNTGGTIVADRSLVVASVGDISNLSGMIRGGNVALSSTEGSIVNQTVSTSGGGDRFYNTVVGKTAGIESTGTLSLSAARDITNIGAQMTAGTDATLKAGGNVVFDTIANKNTSTTLLDVKGGSGYSTTSKTDQVQSGLTVGGNLAASAGQDIILAGTTAKVGGDASLDATNINIVARENSTSTQSETRTSGFGQNNSLYGSTTTTTDTKSVRNLGSTLEVGGNASLNADKAITVQGSDLNVAGSGQIKAQDVNFLAGQNYDESKTSTTRTGIMQVSGGGGVSGSTAVGASAAAGGKSASAQASASATGTLDVSAGLAFYGSTTTATENTDLKYVGSNLSFGKSLTVDATNLTLQGSKVSAGEDVNLNVTNTKLLAAEDQQTSSTSTSNLSIGLMASSKNTGAASANAQANATASGSPSASASAEAKVEGRSQNTLDFMQASTSTTDTLSTRNQGSSISAGRDLNVTGDSLTLQGSQMSSGRDMAVDVNTQRFEAVNDRDETRTSGSKTSAGLYVDVGASYGARVAGNVDKSGASGTTEVTTTVSAAAGIYGTNTTSNSVEGSTTAVTSGLSAGRNLTRTADTITDVGTTIKAGGDFNQTATTWTSEAARDTTYASSDSSTHTAKFGVMAEGKSTMGVNYQVGKGSSPGGGGQGGSAGVTAGYEYSNSTSSSNTSNAVVSTIQVGGNMDSRTSGATSLEGTNIAAGSATLVAESLDYRAAANTVTNKAADTGAGGIVTVDIANKSVTLDANYANDKGNNSSSTAVVGGIQTTQGGLTIVTQRDMNLEGTALQSAGGATVVAGGNLNYQAAKNTTTSGNQDLSVDASVTVGMKGGSGSAAVGYGNGSSQTSDAVVGTIQSGSGDVTLVSGGNMRLEGTGIQSGAGATIAAGGNLDFAAAQNTTSSNNLSVDVAASASGSRGGSSGGAGGAGTSKSSSGSASVDVGVGKGSEQTSTAVVGSVQTTGGNLTIVSGGNARLEGTALQSSGAATLASGGDLTFAAAQSTTKSDNLAVQAGVSGSGSRGTDTKAGSSSSNKSGGGSVAVGVGVGSGNSNVATAGSIQSGTGDVTVASGGNMRLEGTGIKSGAGATIASAGDLVIAAAQSTSSSNNTNVDVALSGSGKSSQTGKATTGATGTAGGTTTSKVTAGTGTGTGAATGSSASKEGTGSVSVGVGVGSNQSTTATAASIEATGGNVAVVSGGNMRLEGTQIKASGDAAIASAGDLVYEAVRNTGSASNVGVDVALSGSGKSSTPAPASSTGTKAGATTGTASATPASSSKAGGTTASSPSTNTEGSASAKVGVNVSSGNSNVATAGSVEAGTGNLSIVSGGDMRLEGTNLKSGGAATVASAGNLVYDALRSTNTSNAVGVNVEASGGKTQTESKGAAKVGVGVDVANARTEQGGSIQAAGPVVVAAGGNATLTGTALSGQGVTVAAVGDLALNAADSFSKARGIDVQVAGSGGKTTPAPPTATPASASASAAPGTNQAQPGSKVQGEGSVRVGVNTSDTNTQAGVKIEAGSGQVNLVSGGNMTMEGTQATGGAGVMATAGGDIVQRTVRSSSSGLSLGISASGSGSTATPATPTPAPAPSGTAAKGATGIGGAAGGTGAASGAAGTASSGTSATSGSGSALPGTLTTIGNAVGTRLPGLLSRGSSGGSSVAAASANAGTSASPGATDKVAAGVGAALNGMNTDGTVAAGQASGHFDSSSASSSQATQLGGGAGAPAVVTSQAGPAAASAAGSIVAQATQGSRATTAAAAVSPVVVASVVLTASMPHGKQATAVTATGQRLPDWLTFDASKGTFTGTPPADFKGEVNVQVKIPQADGSIRILPVSIKP